MKIRQFLFILIVSIFLIPLSAAEGNILDFLDEITPQEAEREEYYVMVDSEGKQIMIGGRRIFVGDSYLNEDNCLYEVVKVEGRTAYAEFVEKIELASPAAVRTFAPIPVQAPSRLIAIYHTHNDECYLPEDGIASVYGKGGIHDVGAAFAETLESKGIQVAYDETMHLPHDRSAYRRSRATAVNLLEKDPDVIFDIHRDAAPPDFYQGEVAGETITQIRIVVGRTNPNMWINREFALDLKGYADEMYPGLVKGLFMAYGNYNQDLTPLNLLLEVGGHTNSKADAEEGIRFFADVVAYYFYGPEGSRNNSEAENDDGTAVPPGQSGGQFPGVVGWTILGVLSVTVLGLFGFLLLNAKNPRQAWQDFVQLIDRARNWLKVDLGRIVRINRKKAAEAFIAGFQWLQTIISEAVFRLRETAVTAADKIKELLQRNKI